MSPFVLEDPSLLPGRALYLVLPAPGRDCAHDWFFADRALVQVSFDSLVLFYSPEFACQVKRLSSLSDSTPFPSFRALGDDLRLPLSPFERDLFFESGVRKDHDDFYPLSPSSLGTTIKDKDSVFSFPKWRWTYLVHGILFEESFCLRLRLRKQVFVAIAAFLLPSPS